MQIPSICLTGKVARLVHLAGFADWRWGDRVGSGAQHADTIDLHLTGKVHGLLVICVIMACGA